MKRRSKTTELPPIELPHAYPPHRGDMLPSKILRPTLLTALKAEN